MFNEAQSYLQTCRAGFPLKSFHVPKMFFKFILLHPNRVCR